MAVNEQQSVLFGAGSRTAVFNADGLQPLIRSNLVAHGYEDNAEIEALFEGIEGWLHYLEGVDPEKAELVREHRQDFEKKLHDYAMKDGFGDSALALGYRSRTVNKAAGQESAAEKNRRFYQKVLDDMVMHQALQNHIDALNRQIGELGQRAEAITEYLESGDFETDADGRLRNADMERELREYERRAGKKVDRTDADAVHAALLLQQGELLATIDKASDLVRRAEAGELTIEEIQQARPKELDRATAYMNKDTAAETEKLRGYNEFDQELTQGYSHQVFGDQSSGPPEVQPTSPDTVPLTGFGSAASAYVDQPQDGTVQLSGLFAPVAAPKDPKQISPDANIATDSVHTISGEKLDLG